MGDPFLFGRRLANGDEDPEDKPPMAQPTASSNGLRGGARNLEEEDFASSASKTCFDYTGVIEIGEKECSWGHLYHQIRAVYVEQEKEPWAQKWYCRGGLWSDLRALTNTTDDEDHNSWKKGLQALCDGAIRGHAEGVSTSSWGSIEGAAIDMEEYIAGTGFLNDETGNLQQKESEFTRRGGYDRFHYVGTDPRLNDYMPTTEASYQGGQAIYKFYGDEAKKTFLNTPTSNFESGCPATNAAVCCWHRDRQYFDNNGSCHETHCVKRNPGDNTDLCWTEDEDGEIFPYPTEETEGDMHCHGFAWGNEGDELDVNTAAKWNNLFFVSMYDHLYQRGYVNSITDDPAIMGEQAMCGCVEDMNPIARADCTEAIGRSNYTAYQDAETGLFVVDINPEAFHIEFRACEGYDYLDEITPEEFAEVDYNAHSAGLSRQNNDLSAFMFRQYLEGKVDLEHTEAFEETIIGYKDPTVNDGDNQREAACKAAFEERFPDEEWVLKEIEEETTEDAEE